MLLFLVEPFSLVFQDELFPATSHKDRHSTPTGRPLTLSDLPQLVNLLSKAAKQWYLFGLQLHVPLEQLDSIEVEHRQQTQIQLTKMLIAWLNGAHQPTVDKIVRALRSESVNEKKLANTVEKAHFKCKLVCNQHAIHHCNKLYNHYFVRLSLYPGV